ncbi:nucleotide sugar dehydrogenase [Ceraceosorus guamensis]|uniref:UDP-glucose 6-dehydrogenase n=1 Tax=Ceraceosorus guamensis TaxID=1522189 RepID=A0A316VN11_9BASI|nr:nucleotide sugar dehydrogenase [Ceraceosorus guamensis]PWN38947.1 nucleotide sugar dehydrogenase [Ceraceosorus guamensis]
MPLFFENPSPRSEPIQSICCIGAGYVGGPTCAVLAWKCPNICVTIVDISQERIDAWNSDELPIFEPGLEEIVKSRRGKNLFFSTDIDAAIIAADLVFVSVNTPTKTRGVGAGYAADLQYVEAATRRIALLSTKSKIIVEKSTVPCRTAESMRAILDATSPRPGVHFDILSNPEFLAEGTAVQDLLKPDRILIGALNTKSGKLAQDRLANVYATWVERSAIITTGLWSSELTKLAANALLAQRISSISSLAAICEKTGAEIDEVARGCGKDSRLGPHFLKAGLGFGGSCFQKDIFNLIYLAETFSLQPVADYWRQVLVMNEWTKASFSRTIIRHMFSTVSNKKIALLGFAFKKDTGDTRESPAISIARDLLVEGAEVYIYDPKVSERNMRQCLGAFSNFHFSSSVEAAALNASAVVVATDWDEFKPSSSSGKTAAAIDWTSIYANMNRPAFVFDGRGILDTAALQNIGFKVHTVGRGNLVDTLS